MRTLLGLAFAVVVTSASTASAIPTVNLPDFVLAPNTAGQTITLTVSGGNQIAAFNLVMDIGGGAFGPIMTGVSIIGPGLIFSGNNTGDQSPFPSLPNRVVAKSVTTASNFVTATGNLVKVTLDTTGIPAGQYHYRLNEVPGIGYSDFGPDVFGETIFAGFNYTTKTPDPNRPGFDFGFSLLTISAVPEPSSVGMLFVGLVSFGYLAVRSRQQRQYERGIHACL